MSSRTQVTSLGFWNPRVKDSKDTNSTIKESFFLHIKNFIFFLLRVYCLLIEIKVDCDRTYFIVILINYIYYSLLSSQRYPKFDG